MTKERSLAIEMWEEICKHPSSSIAGVKDSFCDEHDLDWKHGCWFCQYVRKDYRSTLKSRKNIEPEENACEACPLYKWFAAHNDDVPSNFCGCDVDKATLYTLAEKGDEEARMLILKALKGEKI